jgi:hypothetical protein
MPSLVRSLLVAAALCSSGVLQVAAAIGEDSCCAEERGTSCPDCPLGLVCSCCPFRGAVQVAVSVPAPVASPAATVITASAEPNPRTPVADIFHPPRA